MTKIYKYQFTISPHVVIEMPDKAKILSVQVQDGIPTIWASVDTLQFNVNRKFYIYGTGETVHYPKERFHIATIQLNGFVWHILE